MNHTAAAAIYIAAIAAAGITYGHTRSILLSIVAGVVVALGAGQMQEEYDAHSNRQFEEEQRRKWLNWPRR